MIITNPTIEKVDIKQVKDPDWEEWHTNLPKKYKFCVGGSKFPAILGFNSGRSPRKALCEAHGQAKPETVNSFAKQAMEHGRTYERTVLEMYADINRDDAFWIENTIAYSTVFRYKNTPMYLVSSPDFHGNDVIVEVKCPFYGMNDASCAEEFAKNWVDKKEQKNGDYFGERAYFLQAAF